MLITTRMVFRYMSGSVHTHSVTTISHKHHLVLILYMAYVVCTSLRLKLKSGLRGVTKVWHKMRHNGRTNDRTTR